jgi:hypothetical protein
MVGETPADQDGGMPSSRQSSHAERSLSASAPEIGRAASDLQKPSDADDIPMLEVSLSHVEGALDRLSVSIAADRGRRRRVVRRRRPRRRRELASPTSARAVLSPARRRRCASRSRAGLRIEPSLDASTAEHPLGG